MPTNEGSRDGRSLVIVGGGPSGIAAALEATRNGASATVIERLDRVGGLARTIDFQGCRFDVGPHRFFTLNPEVHDLFVDVCGPDVCRVSRLTRIFYNRKYFDYPLTPINALFGMGMGTSLRILASYLAARVRRVATRRPIVSFEDWIVDRFGRRLFETFFKTYTEKVWGISCRDISADWAAQRIKGLSLLAAVTSVVRPRRKVIKTLVDEFLYPRRGAGQLYEKMEAMVIAGGGTVLKNAEIVGIERDGFRVTSVLHRGGDGVERSLSGDYYLSSAPLTDLVQQIRPALPDAVLAAARSLRYRNHVGVNLVLRGQSPFPDNWIYVHSPDVRMARISDYRNFSAEMTSAPDIHALTVEYFCFADDDIWTSDDETLTALAMAELRRMGISHGALVGSFVVRSAKAYPVIEVGCEARIEVIKACLDRFENLLPIGRSGMFKYNNQDHAMATGLYAARTALGKGHFDPWLVNIDGVYLEGGRSAP
jgi:protoporphyrinogen oxidase